MSVASRRVGTACVSLSDHKIRTCNKLNTYRSAVWLIRKILGVVIVAQPPSEWSSSGDCTPRSTTVVLDRNLTFTEKKKSGPLSRRLIPDVMLVSLGYGGCLRGEKSVKYPSYRYLSLNPLRGRMVSQAHLYEEKVY